MRAPRVLLTEFGLRAYRSCKSASFSPDARITALIGPNGAGKTNVLQGLMLLCGLQRRPFRRDDDDVSTLKSEVSATFMFKKKPIRLRTSIVYRPTDQNRDEVLQSQEEWNFCGITGKDKWLELPPYREFRYLVRNRLTSRSKRYYMVHSPRSGTRVRVHPDPELPDSAWRAMEAIHDFRSRTVYYSASQFTNPTLCPPSFEIDEDGDLFAQAPPGSRSSEHLQFIHQLYRMKKTQQSLYLTYLSLVDHRGVGLIRGITWKETKFSTKAYEVRARDRVITKTRNRLLIIPTVHIGESQLSFAQLSEGTFRTLAVLFYVVTDRSRLLLIEEPEVCVHHGLLTSVVDIIREFSVEKQIIFSTHSDTVLDKLKPEQVRLVSKSKSGTHVNTISKKMSARQFDALKSYLQTEGSLGDYWRHSGFDE